MPTYEFLHRQCTHEWELELSIKAPDPDVCPNCGGKEDIVRLISGGSGKGKVVLTGHELIQHIKDDAKRIEKEASQDANTYASLIGEERYHQIQTQLDRRKR
jgi:putative FmdB family regulatory protein